VGEELLAHVGAGAVQGGVVKRELITANHQPQDDEVAREGTIHTTFFGDIGCLQCVCTLGKMSVLI
jgi:hypothetical protein